MVKKSTLEYFVPSDKLGLSSALIMTDQSRREIVITDFETGALIEIHGAGFKVKGGEIKQGDIDGFDIVNGQGKLLLSFTDLEVDAAVLPSGMLDAVVSAMFQLGLMESNIIRGSGGTDVLTGANGKDFVSGRGGADLIAAGVGRDVMRGGGGEDEFAFQTGDGKDTILDFDADGSDGKQDQIDADFFSLVSISKSGKDTILDFGGGDKVTLVGVKPTEIDMTDFV